MYVERQVVLGTPTERFWAKVEKTATCWEWQGGTNGTGYGRFNAGTGRTESRVMLAHRYAKELEIGRELASDEWVLHHCDNPPCVRPDHLYVGTQDDNMADMLRRGRYGDRQWPAGEDHPRAALSNDEVATIRTMRGSLTAPKVAQRFGVSESTIYAIWNGQNWATT